MTTTYSERLFEFLGSLPLFVRGIGLVTNEDYLARMTDGTRYTVPATSESQAAGRLNIDWPGGRRSQLQGDGTTIAELAIIETVTFWHAQGLIEDKQSAVVELLAHFNCRTKRQDWEPRLTAKREREYQALIEKYTQTPTSQMLLELVRYVAMN